MKLIFTKDANNEINVQLQKGTVIEDFSYTEMVSQLLIDNVFEDTEFTNLLDEEKLKIQNMLDKIHEVFKIEELPYKLNTYYIFNTQVEHTVYNFETTRYLLSIEFAKEKHELKYEDIVKDIKVNYE